MGCFVSNCKCESIYQDEKYGKGQRVFNELPRSGKGDNGQGRCTICGATKGQSKE